MTRDVKKKRTRPRATTEDREDEQEERRGRFGASSVGVKAIVSGLTDLVGGDSGAWWSRSAGDASSSGRRRRRRGMMDAIDQEDVLESIRADFVERCYLWTGDIETKMYDEDCVFTDPTLQFRGLERFERNMQALRPIVKRFVESDRFVDLEKITLDAENASVYAEWRMCGKLKLPWKPVIDVRGKTRYTLGTTDRAGGRIVRYDEEWRISATEALMQLITPGTPKT